jgi:hypothetical protein
MTSIPGDASGFLVVVANNDGTKAATRGPGIRYVFEACDRDPKTAVPLQVPYEHRYRIRAFLKQVVEIPHDCDCP